VDERKGSRDGKKKKKKAKRKEKGKARFVVVVGGESKVRGERRKGANPNKQSGLWRSTNYRDLTCCSQGSICTHYLHNDHPEPCEKLGNI